MVICLERVADLHMSQLMPLPLTVFCFCKIQIGFTFLVQVHPGSPGQRAVKRVCVCEYTIYIAPKSKKNQSALFLVQYGYRCFLFILYLLFSNVLAVMCFLAVGEE